MGADVRNGHAPAGAGDVEDAVREAMDEGATDGSSSEEEEDEEEDDEPTLKYTRVSRGVDEVLARETISSVAVSDKYIALGLHSGAAFVLDQEATVKHKWKSHTATINHIELDAQSSFVACASMDGRVTIRSLASDEHAAFDLKRPVQSVSLEPAYAKRSTRQCVSGGMAGILTLHEKGWLGHKETVLYEGDGPIWTTAWRANLIVWATDAGVRVYDTASSTRIALVARPNSAPRADLYPCSIKWTSDTSFLFAWADTIKLVSIRSRERPRGLNNAGLGGTELFAEVTAVFQVDCMISGITLHANGFLILAYPVPDDAELDSPKRPIGSRPELRIISPEGEELSNDVLGLRNYEKYQCRDYKLVASAATDVDFTQTASRGSSQGRYFVSAPTDLVVASDRDENDHIDWLLENERFEDAVAAIERLPSSSSRFDVHQIGIRFLRHLVDTDQYERAAQNMGKVLGFHAKEWEDWVFFFAGKDKLDAITPFVPTSNPQLGRVVYEMILGHYMQHDRVSLLKAVNTWPQGIYDAGAIVLALKGSLEASPTDRLLLEAAVELYTKIRQPGKALPYLLRLRRPDVFDFVKTHNLASDLANQVLDIVEFDRDVSLPSSSDTTAKHGQAIDLLVSNTDSIPVSRVVDQLEGHNEYLYRYLDALFERDPHLGCDYSDLQVSLYAQYAPARLLAFLRASNYYSLEAALRVCESHDLVAEQVFILGRLGDNKRALRLVLSRLNDVDRAIDFAAEQNDAELWEDLLAYAESRPAFLKALLERSGLSELDPLTLVSRIAKGVEIQGLKPALIKILQDANLRLSLMHGCLAILGSDVRSASVEYRQRTRSGALWTHRTTCTDCGEAVYPHLDHVLTIPAKEAKSAVRFLCGHTYDLEHAFPADPPLLDGITAAGGSGTAKKKRDALVVAQLAGTRSNARRVHEVDLASAHKVRLVGDLKAALASSSSASSRRSLSMSMACARCATTQSVVRVA